MMRSNKLPLWILIVLIALATFRADPLPAAFNQNFRNLEDRPWGLLSALADRDFVSPSGDVIAVRWIRPYRELSWRHWEWNDGQLTEGRSRLFLKDRKTGIVFARALNDLTSPRYPIDASSDRFNLLGPSNEGAVGSEDLRGFEISGVFNRSGRFVEAATARSESLGLKSLIGLRARGTVAQVTVRDRDVLVKEAKASDERLSRIPEGKRVALVIGNGSYAAVPKLLNAKNDAAALSASLRQLGFTVTTLVDLDQSMMRRGLREFAEAARGSDAVLVYFAGHGIEMGGTNYLIPIDARLENDADVAYEAVPLDLVLQAIKGAKVSLVLLDACRNNPFAAQMKVTGGASRSVTRGLARIEPDGDVIVAYAAKDGTTAEDGKGSNSPFATALLRRLPTPGMEVGLLFRQVRDDVMRDTGNRQQPFTYGSVGGAPFYFVLPDDTAP